MATTQRSYGIDLARTIAILGVVLVHSGVFNNGRFGVQLFFLVSGYLLADLGNLSSRDFLVRRAFRLFPLYWVVLVLYYRSDYDSVRQFLISLFLIQSTHWIFTSIPGAWSISNEWLFSLLLPVIKKISRNKIIALIGISWLGQFFTSYLVYRWGGVNLGTESGNQYELKVWLNTFNPAINVSFFLIGIGLKQGLLPILKSRFVGFLIIIFGQLAGYFIGHGLLFIWPPILWALFSICLNWDPKSNIVKKVISFIGQRTYGIFFIHFIILGKVEDISLVRELPETLELRHWMVFVITLFISSLLAEVSWRFIEKPSIRISRRFMTKKR